MSPLPARPARVRAAALAAAVLLAGGSLSACVKERGPADDGPPPKPWETLQEQKWADAQEIIDDTVEEAAQYGIDLGVWVRVVGGPEEGRTAEGGELDEVYAASTIKAAVMATAVHKFGDDLTETVTVDGDDIVPVSVAGWGQYTVGQLLQNVSSYSCNTSANALIDAVGGFDEINDFLESMGVPPEYHIVNKLFIPSESGERNTISPEAAGIFMTRLQEAADGDPYEDFMSVDDARQLLGIFTSGGWQRTGGYVGQSAQKTGDTAEHAHDMGILYTPGGAIAFGAMTTFEGSWNEAVDAIMARMGQRLYKSLPAWGEVAGDDAVPTWWNPFRPDVEPADPGSVELTAPEEETTTSATTATDDATGSGSGSSSSSGSSSGSGSSGSGSSGSGAAGGSGGSGAVDSGAGAEE
ncbi:serine hydrolase [Corynebacterium sp. 335C]